MQSRGLRINRDNFTQILMTSVPGFKANPEFVPERLDYPIINDFARYICAEASFQDWERVRQAVDFLERSLNDGDAYVADLVHECLETLTSCDEIDSIKKFFKEKVLGLWNQYFGHGTDL